MDDVSIPGPACPICGGSAFRHDGDDDAPIEIGDARCRSRVCAECGNIQLVLTRANDFDPCLSSF